MVYSALARKEKIDTLLYTCLKDIRRSTCNKVKAKYMILITHVPHLFRQYQALDNLTAFPTPRYAYDMHPARSLTSSFHNTHESRNNHLIEGSANKGYANGTNESSLGS